MAKAAGAVNALRVPGVDPDHHRIAFQNLRGTAPNALLLSRDRNIKKQTVLGPADAEVRKLLLTFESPEMGDFECFRKGFTGLLPFPVGGLAGKAVPKQQV